MAARPRYEDTLGKTSGVFPNLEGTDKVRVSKANALLKRMHEIMREFMRIGLPFYLENPLRSKLWMHPYVRKWVEHQYASTLISDYCQFGEDWQKPT